MGQLACGGLSSARLYLHPLWVLRRTSQCRAAAGRGGTAIPMDSAGPSGDTETCWAGGGEGTHTNTPTLTYSRIQFTHTQGHTHGVDEM